MQTDTQFDIIVPLAVETVFTALSSDIVLHFLKNSQQLLAGKSPSSWDSEKKLLSVEVEEGMVKTNL